VQQLCGGTVCSLLLYSYSVVLSCMLFAVYVNDIILALPKSGHGCYFDNMFIGCIMYADDLLLLLWNLWSPYVIGQTIMFSCCLWSPYVIGQIIIFSSCFFFFLFLLSFFSSPNLSGRRLDVYHTLAHGVALVRI